MGKRLLRFSISHPFRNPGDITERQRRVSTFVDDRLLARDVGSSLEGVGDIERDTARASSFRLSPRNLQRFASSLESAVAVADRLKGLPPNLLDELKKLSRKIRDTLEEEPPSDLSSGGVIRDGVDPHLDELRRIQREGDRLLKDLEEKERRRTGIQNLRVGYVSAFGYYYEVPRSQRRRVPEDFLPIQSLRNFRSWR